LISHSRSYGGFDLSMFSHKFLVRKLHDVGAEKGAKLVQTSSTTMVSVDGLGLCMLPTGTKFDFFIGVSFMLTLSITLKRY